MPDVAAKAHDVFSSESFSQIIVCNLPDFFSTFFHYLIIGIISIIKFQETEIKHVLQSSRELMVLSGTVSRIGTHQLFPHSSQSGHKILTCSSFATSALKICPLETSRVYLNRRRKIIHIKDIFSHNQFWLLLLFREEAWLIIPVLPLSFL